MGRFGRSLVLVVELLAAGVACALPAQGVTTAALYGVVRGADASAIAEAVATVTTTANGGRWRTTTRVDGRYTFEYLPAGGPYSIHAKAIGFTPAGTPPVTLLLGVRHGADIMPAAGVGQLTELTAQAAVEPLLAKDVRHAH
jgi:hypothetical protein